MKEKEIRVLMVEPYKYPKEMILRNELESLQEAVDGRVDIIGLDDNVCILLNDEGKLIGLEGNRSLGDDIIAGTFYVCGSDDEGNLTYAEALLEIMRKQMADQARTCCMRLMKHISKMIESDYNRQKEYVAVADKKLMRTILEKKEALGQKI